MPSAGPRVPRPHLAVVGLMGSGKTTVGTRVAAALSLPYRDNDEQLLGLTGRSAAELAAAQGLDALHRLEEQALLRQLADDDPAVVAAAAWTVESRRCRDALRARAFVVWLSAEVAVLAARAATGSHRPLDPDALAQLRRQAAVRVPHFRAVAHLTVDVTSLGPDEAAATVVAAAHDAGFDPG